MSKLPIFGPLRHALACLFALGTLQVAVAAQTSTSPGAAARVSRLAQEVERAESVRAVKRLQETYAQYSQFGLWTDMAALFADDAMLSRGKEDAHGRQAILEYFVNRFGGGRHGLAPGALHTQLVMRPLINLSADGQTAKGRWWEFSMLGRHGGDAEWAGGIFENEYVRENGRWKISRLRYNPMLAGPYSTGWRNVDEDQKIVPYHFTPDEAGIPVPELSPGQVRPADPRMNVASTLAALEQRILVMNEEDQVRNLQNAYGYYMDRKMWDDVTDLFTADGALSIADVGVYDGPKSIRRALERSGPQGIQRGQLNELVQLDMAVSIESDGMEARSRGIEFGLLGDTAKATAFYTLAVFENRYVKQDGKWRIREMRLFPLLKTDYAQGWAKSRVVDPAPSREHAPDRPVMASDRPVAGAIPVFFQANPATGQAVKLPAGAKALGHERLLPPPRTARAAAPTGDLDARIREAERRLAVSKAWDAAENLNSAYGDYLDDLDYGPLGRLFAEKGTKEVPFRGIYITRERIMARDATSPPPGGRPRTTLPIHWRTQPVIHVAADGRSANIRSRLLQAGSSRTRGSGFNGGMYNDQAVLENGVWKLWSVSIDEFHWQSASYEAGWAGLRTPAALAATPTPVVPPAAPRAPAAAPAADPYPPDIPNTELGERERGFRGGPGETINWPDIVPMWFHYKNPVSGRQPPYYWPDCESCIKDPSTSMKNHGYLLPE